MAGGEQLLKQLVGVVAYAIPGFGLSCLVLYLIKTTMGVGASAEHQRTGLDSHEHGMRGYTITYED